MYSLSVANNKLIGIGVKGYSEMGVDYPITEIEVSEEVYNDYKLNPNKYMYSEGQAIVNPNYEQEETQKREQEFKKDFFLTSLGWIRRKPTLADGTEDDFLNNDLPLLAIGLMTGSNPILPIAYQLPDFTHEFTKEYMESLQVKNQPITQQFIAECSAVKMRDFTG